MLTEAGENLHVPNSINGILHNPSYILVFAQRNIGIKHLPQIFNSFVPLYRIKKVVHGQASLVVLKFVVFITNTLSRVPLTSAIYKYNKFGNNKIVDKFYILYKQLTVLASGTFCS